MTAFKKEKISHGNLKANQIEKEICETLDKILNSFHYSVNAFIALERKHDEIVGTIN